MNPQQYLYEQITSLNLWHEERLLARNDFLKIGGAKDSNIYFVVEGSIRMFIVDEAEEHTIRFGYRDNFVTALDSFITDEPSELWMQALRKTRVKVLAKSVFESIIESSAENTAIWIQLLQQLIVQHLEREQDILTQSPARRYERVLKRSPQLFQEIPNKYIASYLRMTPETLSRLKKS